MILTGCVGVGGWDGRSSWRGIGGVERLQSWYCTKGAKSDAGGLTGYLLLV